MAQHRCEWCQMTSEWPRTRHDCGHWLCAACGRNACPVCECEQQQSRAADASSGQQQPERRVPAGGADPAACDAGRDDDAEEGEGKGQGAEAQVAAELQPLRGGGGEAAPCVVEWDEV